MQCLRLSLIVIGSVALAACSSGAKPRSPVAPVAPPASTSGLIAYLPLDGSYVDATQGGHDGSTSAPPRFVEDRCGRNAHAARFDGKSNFLEVTDSRSDLKVSEGITVAMWLKAASFTRPYQNLASDHAPDETSAGAGKILRLAGADLQFIVGGVYGHGSGVFAHKQLEANNVDKWVHVVGTYDRQRVQLFINGALVDSRAAVTPMAKNHNPMLIGKSGYVEFFEGELDDILFYDHALSGEEISTEYQRQKCNQ